MTNGLSLSTMADALAFSTFDDLVTQLHARVGTLIDASQEVTA